MALQMLGSSASASFRRLTKSSPSSLLGCLTDEVEIACSKVDSFALFDVVSQKRTTPKEYLHVLVDRRP